MEEGVQGGPTRERGRGGRGTRGRGRDKCANRGRGLDDLEDAAVGGGRGAADRWHGHGRGRVSNVERQRLVDAFEDGDDYHELAALLGIPYQTARSIIRVWLAEGRVQRLPEGGARNIKLTDDMQAFIKDEQEELSPPSPRLVRNWRFASQTTILNQQFRFPDRHLQNQLTTTKIAGKDIDVPYERNRPNTIERRFQYATWLVNLGQYSHLPVCVT